VLTQYGTVLKEGIWENSDLSQNVSYPALRIRIKLMRIRITLMRIRILLATWIRIRILILPSLDPDPEGQKAY
jgi:hypothetical protein